MNQVNIFIHYCPWEEYNATGKWGKNWSARIADRLVFSVKDDGTSKDLFAEAIYAHIVSRYGQFEYFFIDTDQNDPQREIEQKVRSYFES